MKTAKTILSIMCIMIVVSVIGYSIIGTPCRVDKIKQLAPQAMKERGWKILRYEGFEYGSWATHGGKVWYHVANIDNPNIQYRVFLTLWGDELQFYYGEPEKLNRLQILDSIPVK